MFYLCCVLKKASKGDDIQWTWDYRKFPDGFSFCFLRNGDKSSIYGLSKKAAILLNYMKNNNNRLDSIKEAGSLLGLKPEGVYPYIIELINAKKIERIGSRKTGYWILLS